MGSNQHSSSLFLRAAALIGVAALTLVDGRGMQIYFSVDATLGSEFAGGATMDVHGAFRATFPPAACP